jgi:hypothetical protein
MLCTATAAHVRSVNGITVFKRELGHAAQVSGIARAFEPVQHDNFPTSFAPRPLRVDEDLDIGLGFDVPGLRRELPFIESTDREVREERKQVRVPQERRKLAQP